QIDEEPPGTQEIAKLGGGEGAVLAVRDRQYHGVGWARQGLPLGERTGSRSEHLRGVSKRVVQRNLAAEVFELARELEDLRVADVNAVLLERHSANDDARARHLPPCLGDELDRLTGEGG